MTTVRWVVDFPQDQLGTGGWIEYPDERTARAHAGTAATVWALVPAEAVRVLEAARAYRDALRDAPDTEDLDWGRRAIPDGRAQRLRDRRRPRPPGVTMTEHRELPPRPLIPQDVWNPECACGKSWPCPDAKTEPVDLPPLPPEWSRPLTLEAAHAEIDRQRAAVERLTAERLTAERDQALKFIDDGGARGELQLFRDLWAERDGVRAELARMAGDLDDARSTASSYLGTALALRAEVIELRNARKQRDEAIAERDAMRPVVERVRALVTGWREMDPAASLDVGEVVAEIEDALNAPPSPGVDDAGTSEPRSATHGDAGPADGAVAAESDPLAEAIAAYFGGFVQEEGATYRHNDFAEGLIESLTDAGWNLDAIGHPNTWALPDEHAPLGYVVLLWEHDRWNDDWDGEVHRTREEGDVALEEARAAGFPSAVLTAAIPVSPVPEGLTDASGQTP